MMFTRRRKLPNSKKTHRWYVLALPLLIFIGSVGIFLQSLLIKPHFMSALPDKIQVTSSSSRTEDILTQEFTKAGFQVDSVRGASDTGYLVQLKSGEVIVASATTSQNQISSLQALLTNLTMEGKRIERLDIRFDKPVVLFKK